MTTFADRSMPRTRVRRVGLSVGGAAAAALLVGVTTAPAHAQQSMHRVRFYCATTSKQNGYSWIAPPGVRTIQVVVAGGAGDSDPGGTGRGGTGAVIEATLDIPDAIVHGDLGCAGKRTSGDWSPGGPGGSAVGAAHNGAAGGGLSSLIAGNNASTDAGAELWAGGGGGGGGRGSGFGVNAGGDGGDAGFRGTTSDGVGESGDQGTPGGGAGGGSKALGNTTCLTPIPVDHGQPGQDAVAAGGGGGGGGAGHFDGGCGGGAGSAVTEAGRPVVGSGGGGQAGESLIRGSKVQSPTFEAGNYDDGYVIITYKVG